MCRGHLSRESCTGSDAVKALKTEMSTLSEAPLEPAFKSTGVSSVTNGPYHMYHSEVGGDAIVPLATFCRR